jgi:hypothetical protein
MQRKGEGEGGQGKKEEQEDSGDRAFPLATVRAAISTIS